MHSMPVLSLVYFRNLSLLSEPCKAKCLDVSDHWQGVMASIC
jgi:proteasome activator subunit 4